jgi:hypothetical protein
VKTNKKPHTTELETKHNKNTAQPKLKSHKRAYFSFSLYRRKWQSGHGLIQTANYLVIKKIKEPQNNLLGCCAQILIADLRNIQHECQLTATFSLTATNPTQAVLRPYPRLRSRQRAYTRNILFKAWVVETLLSSTTWRRWIRWVCTILCQQARRTRWKICPQCLYLSTKLHCVISQLYYRHQTLKSYMKCRILLRNIFRETDSCIHIGLWNLIK